MATLAASQMLLKCAYERRNQGLDQIGLLVFPGVLVGIEVCEYVCGTETNGCSFDLETCQTLAEAGAFTYIQSFPLSGGIASRIDIVSGFIFKCCVDRIDPIIIATYLTAQFNRQFDFVGTRQILTLVLNDNPILVVGDRQPHIAELGRAFYVGKK
jgi:hypothetical protein